uniref:Xylose isomerase domain protein TIM barrel n=1 Tax=Solibacter usitatus (strain Ellin6076) TaxID=234267 RepID=Q021Z1_SOLUE
MMISRRNLLGTAGALALGIPRLKADPLGMPVGCQTYPVRDILAKDFEGTLRQIAAMGYRRIEMCSPASYAEYRPLAAMKPAEMRKKIEDAGLKCESCHYGFRELKENLAERVAYAKELGLTQMVLSSFGLRADATMADYRQAATELNRIGEESAKSGLPMGYHNHNNEFKELDGVLIYDELMRTFDPKLVKMQFQVAVISLGYQAATYLDKYPGRFISMHLADYSTTEKKAVPVGSGVVDWKKLFAAAKTGGIKNYFVEMNLDAMGPSYTYLHALK